MKTSIALVALAGLLICESTLAENGPGTRPSSTVATGEGPSSIAITPSGKYAYVANAGSDSISVFTINRESGRLSAQSTTSLDGAGDDPEFVAVSPTGRFLYVATWSEAPAIVVYRINQVDGSLIASQKVEREFNATAIAIDPSEKFAYVAHDFGVSVFSIGPSTGKLSLRKTIRTQGERPYFIGIAPQGKLVYVTDGNGASPTNGSGGVSVFAINPKTGLLSARGSGNSDINPGQLVVHPNGNYVYVVNEYSSTVSMFAVNQAKGTLTSIGTVNTKGLRRAIAIHPNGRFVYLPEGSNAIRSVDSRGVNRTEVSGANGVSILTVNQETGELIPKGSIDAGDGVSAGTNPTSAVVHPNGKFLYVTNRESNNVSIYAIDTDTGALSIPRY